VRVWIDVENPPQVQYLLPLRPAFEKLGAEVVVTARDYGNTFELLEQAAVPFSPIGTSYGAAKWRKAAGLAGRTRQLVRHLRRTGRPDASVSASRAAAVAGRLLRHPSFVIIDYEHVFLGVQRLTRSYVLYPDVIEASAFRDKGIRDRELLPFRGLKEDLSFAHMNTESEDAHYLPIADDRLVRVLVRPAAEESHYYREESGYMTLDLLERLAGEDRAVVVFSPRYPRQAEYLERFEWRNKPLVLDRAVPFVSLLKAVDVVVSSGGTMLREAAYLGVPAYSTFQGDVGAVDRHLESLGRLHLISSRADFDRISLSKATPLAPLETNPRLVDDIAERVIAAVQGASPEG
jgi:predicted glycosyltransferase